MNGRVYDPEIGRFLSADPFVQFPFSSQGWNRYAYVGNNPLSLTDPSGFVIQARKHVDCTTYKDVEECESGAEKHHEAFSDGRDRLKEAGYEPSVEDFYEQFYDYASSSSIAEQNADILGYDPNTASLSNNRCI